MPIRRLFSLFQPISTRPFAVGIALSAALSFAVAEEVALESIDGRKIQAQLLSLNGDEVKINVRPRGAFTIKLDQLSEESQTLVQEKLGEKEPAVESPGVMLAAKELLIEDPLTEEDWSENWKGGKGDFYAKEDRVVGVEDLSENHTAGAGRIQDMTSAIVQVEFRLDESDEMGIVIDYKANTGNKYDNQHVMKLQIKKEKFSLGAGTGWSDQTRRTPVGKATDVSLLEGWNTVTLEFHEQEMVGHLNGEVMCLGTTEEPIQAPKNQITLVARGSVSFRNLKMWTGDKLTEDWERTKAKLERDLE